MKINPNDINRQQHFWDTFDNNETEISADWIVRFCQQRGGGWENFTYDEINGYYQQRLRIKKPNFQGNFSFNRLTGESYTHVSIHGNSIRRDPPVIIDNGDGSYTITSDFIERCYKASPAVQVEDDAEQEKTALLQYIENADRQVEEKFPSDVVGLCYAVRLAVNRGWENSLEKHRQDIEGVARNLQMGPEMSSESISFVQALLNEAFEMGRNETANKKK